MPSGGEVPGVHSRQLHAALAEFAEQAAGHLHACVAQGEEVPFELDAQRGRRGAASLYCYRPLTDAYIDERYPRLRALAAHASAAQQLEGFGGLDRYLLSRGLDPARQGSSARAQAALLAFLQDVFEEQTDFQLRPERLARGLGRLDGAASAGSAEVTLVATLHGLALASEELQLTNGLLLAQPHTWQGAPDQAVRCPGPDGRAGEDHLLVVYTAQEGHAQDAIAHGALVVRDLVRALRLFGDGRIALGPLAWGRIASGAWSGFALGAGGHPHGMLLVTAEQEDELRAFCNLVSRRAPRQGPIAWALERYEMGCERAHEYQALSDHLLALRALLGGASGLEPSIPSCELLADRLGALCATPDQCATLSERTLTAIELERQAIAGTAVEHAADLQLARELADHLRALLRDVVCGHLPAELASLADELLSEERLARESLGDRSADGLAEQPLGDPAQSGEILDLAV